MPLPKVAKPRTTNDPEAEEIWQLTLQEAIRIGLDNSEVVRVISLGAQGIPVGGFEPTPLNTGAGAGIASALGAGHAADGLRPGDPGDPDRPGPVELRHQLHDQHALGPQRRPVQQRDLGRHLPRRGPVPDHLQPGHGHLPGAAFRSGPRPVPCSASTHNINYLYSNSPTNVTPSAYTTNIQFSLTQPLLGSAPLAGGQPGPPVGLEANRAPIVIARLNADASVWRFKAEVMAHVRSIEQQYWSLAQQHVQLWSSETAVELGRGDPQARAGRARSRPRHRGRRRRGASSGSSSSSSTS